MTNAPATPSPSKSLHWRGNAPVSDIFNDVYYSAENGLEETRHVFLGGIGAPDVWRERDDFVIAETGFGTGLNFLATWKSWLESGARTRLTYISAEGFPLSEKALEEAHQTFPELAPFAAQLRKAWPPQAKGFHPRYFEAGKLRLVLLFGDAAHVLSRLQAQVDAWYLDGFAPAKNPEMWSDSLLDQVARLSKKGTRFATFTAAGFVRRGLSARGFDVRKTSGYGRKRERLVGTAITPAASAANTYRSPEWSAFGATPEGPVTVIGAGIAGASVAAALRRYGRDVQLVSHPSQPTASHVPAAILAPRFMLEDSPAAAFFTSAYAHSCWLPDFAGAWADRPGVTLLPKDSQEAERLAKIHDRLGWTPDWLEARPVGFHLPRGGSVDSRAAIDALCRDIPHTSLEVASLSRIEDGWLIISSSGEKQATAAIVVAGGISSRAILGDIDCPELRPNRGQIEILEPPYPPALPGGSHAYGGYITAATGGSRTLGSTFDRIPYIAGASYEPETQDRKRILAMAERTFGQPVDAGCLAASWAGVRATTADHLPYAGPLADGARARQQYAALTQDARTTGLGTPPLYPGLYMLAGLGSKGFQYSPILGDYLAAQICGTPLPLPTDLVPKLHPLRDMIRTIKRSAP